MNDYTWVPKKVYLFKFTCCNNLNAWALHSQPCPQAPTQTRTKRRSKSKRLGTRLLHSQKRPRLAASCGFTGLLQVVNRLQQVCWSRHQLASSLIEQLAASLMNASMLIQVEKFRLAASCHLQTWCYLFHQLASSRLWISSFDKSDGTSMLMRVEKIRLAASCYPQTCCKLFKQFAARLWITSLDKSDICRLWHLQTCCKLITNVLIWLARF
jgi:hypothetical protein